MRGLIFLLVLAFSSGALADGTPNQQTYEAPFSWTGLYVGVNGGYGWGHAPSHLNFSSTQNTGLAARGVSAAGSATADLDGWFGGGLVGYNWRSGRWLYGVETDFQWTSQEGNSSICATPACVVEADHRLDWFGTLRGRLGYLLDPRSFLYVTGGLAYGHLNTEFSASVPPFSAVSLTDSKTKAGWIIGAGLERALDRNWTLRAEYLYMDLGTVASASGSTSTQFSSPAGPQCDTIVLDAKGDVHASFTDQIFRIGLSYRFAEDYAPLK